MSQLFNVFFIPLQASGRRGASRPDSADALLLSQQKEAWSREKVHLEKALHQALALVARLRGEIRTDTLRELTGPEADNAALKVRQCCVTNAE